LTTAPKPDILTRMKNKTFSQLDAVKSVRKVWDFRPTSRVVADKTKYSRKQKFKSQD
jgi:hypothetical protein